jgi:hypothetical protein
LIYPSKSEKNKKRKIVSNNSEVYDRLYNYSLIKEKILSNLSNKYLIDEEDKYTFIPQINSRDSNYYSHLQKLYEVPHKNWQYYLQGNGLGIKALNTIRNLEKNQGKYFPYSKQENNLKNKLNNLSSFSHNNDNYSIIYDKDYNSSKNIMKNAFKSRLGHTFPSSNKYINKNYNNNLFKLLEEPENGEKYSYLNNNNINPKKIMNKSFSFMKNPSYSLTKRNESDRKSHSTFNVSFPSSNFKISRNSEFKKIAIPKKNGKNIEHEKRSVHSNNSSITSSMGSSILKKSILLKSRFSPEKKERLFSFGSELIKFENKNLNNKRLKKPNKNNNLSQRNSSLKSVNYSIRSQKAQASTKSSGTNTMSCYNNYIMNGNKEKDKNGIEKKNNFEMQSINEYSIINDSNILDNEIVNIQTTLQTLNDSKILDLANNYISEDESLEGYKRRVGIYEKKFIDKK